MLNPNFDPYLELQETKVEVLRQQHLLKQVVNAHNNIDTILLDLTNQHQQLTMLIKQTRYQLDIVQQELLALKQK
jgi:rRNA pseudouridine-1189 N-methylase Emg1 (Nep1/Mra1 family)